MVSTLISSIKGILEDVGINWVDVSVGGVTFRLSIPTSTAAHIGPRGDQVRLFTSLQLREDSIALYGFLTEEGRAAFEVLLSVNGVGPKVALSVLSRLSPEELAVAVSAGDPLAFKGVPGVGTKTASRIVLELKGRLVGEWALPGGDGGQREVMEALTALGYTASEAREAVSSLPRGDSLPLEDRVRLALQHMGSR